MDIKNFNQLEKATQFSQKEVMKLGLAVLFILFSAALAYMSSLHITGNVMILIFAAMVGGYMAINIGANDVANNVGPAVGSRALTMGGAILIAAICEASGAIIAGNDVVNTIRSEIIAKSVLENRETFTLIMLSALISGALWLHLATAVGAPVSTTHSIVGAIMGAGIVAGGVGVVNWIELARIASSWIISPLLGGMVAALFLFIIKHAITYQQDKINAARRVVPWLLFIMSGTFSLYLITKGLSRVISLPLSVGILLSLTIALPVFALSYPLIKKISGSMQNTKEEINRFFTIPLIFAAALLSFAHGTNDVANAIGPLAAISESLSREPLGGEGVPLWIMIIGGAGISFGLALYGPKLIKTVGSEITDLDQIRAFCIAMSAALTVLVASGFGLPVSSTHIAVGAVFGVGFLREHLKKRYYDMEQQIIEAHQGGSVAKIQEFLIRFRRASVRQKGMMLKGLKRKVALGQLGYDLPKFNKKEKKQLQKVYKEELVKRSALNKIIATWVITVPIAALLSAGIFALLRLLSIPL
ncbi:MAG: inorganic phosphate transporter [Wolinella sp.]